MIEQSLTGPALFAYAIVVVFALNILAIMHSDDNKLNRDQIERRKVIKARRTFKIIFWPVWLPIQLVIWAVMILIYFIKLTYRGVVSMKLFKKLDSL